MTNIIFHKDKINILFGTQTGNAESVAEDLNGFLIKKNIPTLLSGLDDIKIVEFKKMKNVVIITSTFGAGDMPENAQLFWKEISSNNSLDLENMRFCILGLGDSSHEEFCNAGNLIDKRLEELKAKKIYEIVECDGEYEDTAKEWINNIFNLIEQ